MRTLRTIFLLGVPAMAAIVVASLFLRPTHAAPPGMGSFMETLEDWKYPGSRMLEGAGLSSGGNPLIQSVKFRAILTTADPIEVVVAFYSTKFKPGPSEGEKVKDPNDAKSVATLDDSQGRPVTVRVFVMNKADTATTIVVSRAADEAETHITWLHYLRLERNR
jgi:hypothetical protein